MEQTNPPIVVVAYNRPKSLKRILSSLIKAVYPKDPITLIISIDNADDNKEVLKIAEETRWDFGDKIVEYQTKNLGLRNHVIKCACYSNIYGSVILLEDDLYVSKQFYYYACQALEFSLEKEYIGGISLYNHQLNVNTKTNFSPIEDGYDNWYFQFASSWGQAWTKKQWNDFLEWYEKNQKLDNSPHIPQNVTRWSDKSWLKYFIHYLVENNKYFLYPKVSLSSNFSDSGTHIEQNSTTYQVPLNHSKVKNYHFSEFSNSLSTYDAFYENTKLFDKLGIATQSLCNDLYGTKLIEQLPQKYLLSCRIYDFKIIRTFGNKLKPMDMNVINEIEGNDIYLYDTTIKTKNKFKQNLYEQIFYNIKYISIKNVGKLVVIMYWRRILQLFKKS